jgi:hypothetical protein
MKVEIRSHLSFKVMFVLETESLRLAVEAAVENRVSLRDATLRGANLTYATLTGADLRGADLRGATLRGANLTGADLTGATLTGAALTGADLRDADLSGADLRDADLRDADLRGASLRDANLTGASLTGASLTYATLTGASLRGANLTPIRDDIWAVLSASPAEVAELRQAILDGKIDGSTYKGACACLVGTLAKARHCTYNDIPSLSPNSNRPAERFFLAIKPGDTPETSQAAKLALDWIDQWLANMRGAFAGVKP